MAQTLWELASKPMVEPRGIVLPLFDEIALLGLSLILELRALNVDLPVEIPHCGDLNAHFIDQLERNATMYNARVYDVCEQAAAASETGPSGDALPLFCAALDMCHQKFRSFDIKVIAVLFSRFQELLLLDADVLFFQSPASLWELNKYTATGTLFFTDRISSTGKYLARPVSRDAPTRSRLHAFVETFDRMPYRLLENVPRANQALTDRGSLSSQGRASDEVRFRRAGTPSEYLRGTHAWSLRAGHHADSSVMLWSKIRQPRATAILGSFVTLRHAHRPPSYGDKELYFLACEVADSDYAFSDYGVGSIGWDADHDQGVLCGDALHFYPAHHSNDSQALYINSDHITSWELDEQVLYRSNARPAHHYPGSFAEKKLPQECPFDVQPIRLTDAELDSFRRRQSLHRRIVETWHTGSHDQNE